MKQLIAVCGVLVTLTTSAVAELLVAVVEDVHGKVTGAEFMDYLAPAAVIDIGDGGSIVLSYMTSCRREKISGIGTVIVGTQESVVHLAEVKSEKIDCDSRQAYMTRENSGVAALVLRSIALPKPQLTLYDASPMVEAKGGGTLVLQRLDVA